MATKKKKLKGITFWKWVNVVGVFGGLVALVVTCVGFLINLSESVEKLGETMTEVKTELRRTSDLVNADLSWRYLYQNDPSRKGLVPRYHPDSRTLEFVDKRTFDSTGVRKP